MRVGVFRVELQIPAARSLKDKRRPLKSLIAQLQNRFHCAVAEVDHQDLHRRAALAVALVAADGKHLARLMQTVREFIERQRDLQVLDIQREVFSGPEAFGER